MLGEALRQYIVENIMFIMKSKSQSTKSIKNIFAVIRTNSKCKEEMISHVQQKSSML